MMARPVDPEVTARRELIRGWVGRNKNEQRPRRLSEALGLPYTDVVNDLKWLRDHEQIPSGTRRRKAAEPVPSVSHTPAVVPVAPPDEHGTSRPAQEQIREQADANLAQPAARRFINGQWVEAGADPFAGLYPGETGELGAPTVTDNLTTGPDLLTGPAQETLTGNLLDGISPPYIPVPPNHAGEHFPAEPLTEDEVSALFRAASGRAPTGIRNRAIIALMFRCGLRVSEVVASPGRPGSRPRPGLKPADIDHKASTVRVLDSKRHRDRTVDVDAGTMAAIDLWLAERKRLNITSRKHLFTTLDGGPVHDFYVRRMVKRYAARAGIEKRVHPHGLRHGYALHLAEQGVSVPIISKALGHANTAVTAVYLGNIAPADVLAALRAVQWKDL